MYFLVVLNLDGDDDDVDVRRCGQRSGTFECPRDVERGGRGLRAREARIRYAGELKDVGQGPQGRDMGCRRPTASRAQADDTDTIFSFHCFSSNL